MTVIGNLFASVPRNWGKFRLFKSKSSSSIYDTMLISDFKKIVFSSFKHDMTVSCHVKCHDCIWHDCIISEYDGLRCETIKTSNFFTIFYYLVGSPSKLITLSILYIAFNFWHVE